MSQIVEAIELEEVAAPAKNDGIPLLQRELGLVGHVVVELSVEVGTAELTIDRLFSLKAGDTVSLLQSVNSPFTLRLDGKTIALGELVAVGENFGIHITDIL